MIPIRNIHINPKFKSAHINPSFLQKSELSVKPPNIHVNPNFLTKSPTTNYIKDEPVKIYKNAPILKTRRKIIRNLHVASNPVKIKKELPVAENTSLVKIGKNKLIRLKPRNDVFKHKTKYKIVRSSPKQNLIKQFVADVSRKSIVKKYFLCRTDNPTPKKVIISDKKLMRIGSSKFISVPLKKTVKYRNKTLEFLNINGVLYKSTNNKLEKSVKTSIKPKISIKMPENSKSGRFLFVRGEKFILESNGKSLKRLNSNSNSDFKLKRIDIGGLTYVAKSDSTYEQTKSHKSRTHLNVAKNKSINVLRKKYAKDNTPCAIYHRLGKCLALERGRCPKVHDKKNIMICPKHLKGECKKENCLLSHDVNLSKMPTCKFFLQGCCFKTDCPYLHKKLNENVEICEEFLNGFCLLADKCSKRHELKKSIKSSNSIKNCPWLEKHGNCLEKNCSYNHNFPVKKEIENKIEDKIIVENEISENSTHNRYFQSTKDNCDIFGVERTDNIEHERKRISNSLPAYIPLDS